jgi:hypothetical protein
MRMIAAALAASLFVAACSSSPAEEDAAPSPSPTATSESPSPSPTPTESAAWPLTGVEADDPATDQPVVSVKIENTPSAYPLAGIEQADIVYEQIVEGGVTRFAALFHSALPDRVGPVRSARFIDVPLLEPWSSILVYSGARGEVTDALRSADHIGLLADPGTRHGPVFFRAPDRPGSHDLLASLPAALEQGREEPDVAAVPEPALAFDEQAPDGGVASEEFQVAMTSSSRAGWQWDEQAGVYRRLQNGNPLVVTGDGRIGPSTVVLIATDIGQGGCCDTAGNPFTVTRLDGEGEAVVWRDGQRFEARWQKDGDAGHLRLVTEDGEAFPLAPGSSWWHLASPSAVPPAPADFASE